MKPRLIIGLVALLATALIVPTAQAATQVRQVQVQIPGPFMSPGPGGTLTLDFVFKNKRTTKGKFTPRQLTRIAFDQVRLTCFNAAGNGTTVLLLTTTMQTAVKVTKAPQPAGKKPKPHRYAFRFTHSFLPAFTGSVRGTIDKANHGPRSTRSQGTLSIEDLDADADHRVCSTGGLKQWGGVPVVRIQPA
jgi:hypothetical protein